MIIKELLTSWKNGLVGALFPIQCVVCEKETGHKKKNKLICSDCLKNLSPSLDFYCPLCEAKTFDGKLCYSCSALGYESHLDRLLYPFSYKDKAVQKIIKAFKYCFIKDLETPLGRLLVGYLEKIGKQINLSDLILIPVPLYKLKYNQRGYNQSELLARQISLFLNSGVSTAVLVKERSTKDQASLENDQRVKNINGVFKSSGAGAVWNKKILLIDDVYTTGATMNECAKVLKEAGAEEVTGLTIARG